MILLHVLPVQIGPEALFLTVSILDRVLAVQHVSRKNLRLVGWPQHGGHQ